MWAIVKVWFVPGSLPFLVLTLGAGVFLLRRPRARQAARALIAAVLGLYLVLSLPFTAQHLAARLQGPYGPFAPSTPVSHPLAIVVLGGDHVEGRIQEAARLYRRLDAEWVVVSGDDELYEALAADRVPRDRIVWERQSSTTREQAMALGPILRARSVRDFVLVASAIHMRRALAAVKATGLRPVPSASDVLPYRRASGLARLAPGWGALRLSEESLYEYGALAAYWARGWLDRAG